MRRKAISVCLSVLFAATVFTGCVSGKQSSVETNNNVQSQQSGNKDNASSKNESNSNSNNSDNQSENKDSNKNDDSLGKNTQSQSNENEENIDISSLAVNGNYTTISSSNDLGEDIKYLRGNGKAYQVVGLTGKGAFVRVYNVKENGIYEVFSDDIEDSKLDKLGELNYLDKSGSKETLILKAPIKVGTRWDNKEIVEVGKDLKVDGMSYKGAYAKVWERESSNTTKVSYYCEGYGCVKYYIMQDKTTISYFKYTKIK